MDQDETIRPDSTPDTLKALKPAFKKDGSVTAGNAPGVNDGAAAVVVMSEARASALNSVPMARIAGYATSGLAPKLLLMTPVESIRKLLKKIGWKLEDVDLFEINEAFAAQMVAIIKELGIDPARVNVNGGAIALGHPIGASGARVLTTLSVCHEAARELSEALHHCVSAAGMAWRWRWKCRSKIVDRQSRSSTTSRCHADCYSIFDRPVFDDSVRLLQRHPRNNQHRHQHARAPSSTARRFPTINSLSSQYRRDTSPKMSRPDMKYSDDNGQKMVRPGGREVSLPSQSSSR